MRRCSSAESFFGASRESRLMSAESASAFSPLAAQPASRTISEHSVNFMAPPCVRRMARAIAWIERAKRWPGLEAATIFRVFGDPLLQWREPLDTHAIDAPPAIGCGAHQPRLLQQLQMLNDRRA